MKELSSNKTFKKPSPARDTAGLSSLVGFLNSTAGVVAPKEISPAAEAVKAAPIVVQPTPRNQAASQAPAAVPVSDLKRIFLTGRFKVGKDYVAKQAGFKIFAFADPLYFLAGYFFGNRPKDEIRIFLQTAGQWGRGTISAEYPLTPERACFIETVRRISKNWTEEPASLLHVDWSSYGRNENIWLDALVTRVKAAGGTKIAVSGVRFQNEYDRLTAEGFLGFHVVASPTTWTARLKQSGLMPESLAAKDLSEHLAASLDASVTKILSQQRQGNKLRVIWSDPNVPPPSSRLLTVPEFVKMFLRHENP